MKTINELFKIKNKYSKIYIELIEQSKNNKNKDRILNIRKYSERHHIIPKSLGGNNSIKNIVVLTAREHYISHLLLFKYFKAIKDRDGLYKMSTAFFKMHNGNKQQKKIYPHYSYLYNKAKEIMGKLSKDQVVARNLKTGECERISKENWIKYKDIKYVGTTKGIKLSKEHKDKIKSNSSKNTVPVYDNVDKINKRIHKDLFDNQRYVSVHKGKVTVFDSKEEKNKMITQEEFYLNKDRYTTTGSKGIKEFTPEIKNKMKISYQKTKVNYCIYCKKGPYAPSIIVKYHGENCKSNTNMIKKEHIPWNKNKKSIRIKCPHCNKEGGQSIMKRWHFNNCKALNI